MNETIDEGKQNIIPTACSNLREPEICGVRGCANGAPHTRERE